MKISVPLVILCLVSIASCTEDKATGQKSSVGTEGVLESPIEITDVKIIKVKPSGTLYSAESKDHELVFCLDRKLTREEEFRGRLKYKYEIEAKSGWNLKSYQLTPLRNPLSGLCVMALHETVIHPLRGYSKEVDENFKIGALKFVKITISYHGYWGENEPKIITEKLKLF